MEQQRKKVMKPQAVGAVLLAAVMVLLGIVIAIMHLGGPSTEPSTDPAAEQYALYWNVDAATYVQDDDLSRKANDDGTCTMRFALEGEIVELKAESRRLAGTLDSVWAVDGHSLMGLEFNEDGVIIGYTRLLDMPLEVPGRLFYVQSMGGGKAKLNSTSNFIGMESMVEVTDNTKIYDMSGSSEYIGAPSILQKGDQVLAIENLAGELTHIFVVGRDGLIQTRIGYCEHCKSDVQWSSWAKDEELPTTSGHFYLTKEVNLKKQQQVAEGAAVCLDLNGFTVNGAANTRIYANFNAGCTLSIMDMTEEKTGKMVASANGASSGYCVWVRYGVFNLYSGTLDGSKVTTTVNGTVVNVAKTTMFNMYGGTIIGGTAMKNADNKNGYGGAVNIGGVGNMYGGTIIGGTAKAGGGNVCVSGNGGFNMYGGELVEGVADGGTGGNIYVGNNATFNLAEGTIRDGKGIRTVKNANGGGGNVLVAGRMTMTGGLITGGKCYAHNGSQIADANGKNLYIRGIAELSGGTVTGSARAFANTTQKADVTLSGNITIAGAPQDQANLHVAKDVFLKVGTMTGGKVGITMASGSGIFTERTSGANACYFFSDIGGDVVAYQGRLAVGKLRCLCGGTDTHTDGCDGTVLFWNPLSSLITKKDGNYYLIKNVSAKYTINTNVNLDMNGYSIINKTDRPFQISGTLNVLNSRPEVEGGGLIMGKVEGARGGVAIVNAGGTLSLFNGVTLQTHGSSTPTNGGVLDVAGTLNLYGGTIIGSDKTTGKGGAVRINGGSINATAGSITGGDVYLNKGTATVSGTAVIGQLSLNNQKLLLGQTPMTEGAKVCIYAPMGQCILKKGEMTDESWQQVKTWVEKGYITSADVEFKVVWKADGLYIDVANPVIHCLCGDKTATDNPCAETGHQDLAWAPWDGTTKLNPGNYYLTKDVTDLVIETPKDSAEDAVYNINLAGHNWTNTKDRAIGVMGGQVNIVNTNSALGGIITGSGNAKRGGAAIIDKGALSLYPNVTVQVTEGTEPTYGGAIEVRSILNIWGAKIAGAAVTHANGGGAVCVNGGEMSLFSGSVIGGTAASGSAISVVKGSLRLAGGSVTDGDVYGLDKVTVVVTGSPVVEELTLAGMLSVAGELKPGAKVVISTAANAKFLDAKTLSEDMWTAVRTYPDSGYFVSGVEGCTVVAKEDGLYMRDESSLIIHCLCGDKTALNNPCAEAGHPDLEWAPWDGTSTLADGGNYYLTQDVEGGMLTITAGAVNIDMAGHNWTVSEAEDGNRVLRLTGGSLNLTNTGKDAQDQPKGGVLTGRGNGLRGGAICIEANAEVALYPNVTVQTADGCAPTYGGAIEVRGKLSLYGAVVKGCKTSHAFGGGAIIVKNNGQLDMYSGTVIGGEVASGGMGSAIAVGNSPVGTATATNGTVRFYGGTVTGGEICLVGGTVELAGGMVKDGRVYVHSGNTITASGNAVTLDNANIVLETVAEGKLLAKADLMADDQWARYAAFVADGTLLGTDTAYTMESRIDGIYAVAAEIGGGEENDERKHCVCGDPSSVGNPCAEAGHQQLTWISWDGMAVLEDGKNYYLNKSVEASLRLETGSVNLDLAGNDLTAPAGSRALYLNGGSISITNTGKDAQDQPKGGLVSGSSVERGATICVHAATSDLVLYSNVTVATAEGTENSYGGAIEVRGNLYIYGATIRGSKVTSSEGGGAICVKGGNVLLHSGTVIGGTAGIGSAITVSTNGNLYGNLHLSGGTVKDGEVYVKTGCHVYAADTATAFENAAVKLRVNEAGKIIVRDADMTDQQWAMFAQYLNAGVIYTTDTDYVLEVTEEGIYGKSAVPPVQGVIHCACGNPASTGNSCAEAGHQQLTWTAWDQAWNEDTALAAGNYYLTQDTTIRQKAIGNAVVNLDMAGFSLTSNYKNVFLMNDGGVLNVCNTGKDGQNQPKGGWIKGIAEAGRGGSLCITHANAVVNLYENVTVRTEDGCVPTYGGAIEVRGTLNMYGATVIGCRVTDVSKGGGAICVNGGNLNVYSGRIIGAEAPVGDAVSVVNGTMTLYGGTVEQGDVYLASGKTVTLGKGWTGNAQTPVAITMADSTGTFADAQDGLTLTDAAKACFAAPAGKTVELVDNTLVLQ